MFDGKEQNINSETVAKAFGVACVESPCALGHWKTVWIPMAIKRVAWIDRLDGLHFMDVYQHLSV
jgi:hypothetical protein